MTERSKKRIRIEILNRCTAAARKYNLIKGVLAVNNIAAALFFNCFNVA